MRKSASAARGNMWNCAQAPMWPTPARSGHLNCVSVAGAYWRGDERNPMLTRIYGTSFPSQELLEEQPIDDTHNAFLVDTGGRMGTLLVTAEAVPYKEASELATYQHVAVWDPAHMDHPLQTVDWEGGFPGEHQILDVNFDGYPDFTILFEA